MKKIKITKDYLRMEILAALNRASSEFPDMKDEIYYYDKKLKCWTIEQDSEKEEKKREQREREWTEMLEKWYQSKHGRPLPKR